LNLLMSGFCIAWLLTDSFSLTFATIHPTVTVLYRKCSFAILLYGVLHGRRAAENFIENILRIQRCASNDLQHRNKIRGISAGHMGILKKFAYLLYKNLVSAVD
jgi:hypothetical protein